MPGQNNVSRSLPGAVRPLNCVDCPKLNLDVPATAPLTLGSAVHRSSGGRWSLWGPLMI